jgi:hypothetical protein
MEIKSYEDFKRATNKCEYKSMVDFKTASPNLYDMYSNKLQKDMQREQELRQNGYCFEDFMAEVAKME